MTGCAKDQEMEEIYVKSQKYLRGIVHQEFVIRDQSVNVRFYFEIQNHLHALVLHINPKLAQVEHWILHYDNTPVAHTLLIIKEFFYRKIDHSQQSPI